MVLKTHRQNENEEGELDSRHPAVKGQGSFSAITWWGKLWLLYSWYAHQVVTNQPVAGWSGNYLKEVQKVRENIMCSLV